MWIDLILQPGQFCLHLLLLLLALSHHVTDAQGNADISTFAPMSFDVYPLIYIFPRRPGYLSLQFQNLNRLAVDAYGAALLKFVEGTLQ